MGFSGVGTSETGALNRQKCELSIQTYSQAYRLVLNEGFLKQVTLCKLQPQESVICIVDESLIIDYFFK